MKILIVDDDKISRMIITRALQKAGYETLEAERATIAIELLNGQEPIALVISDITMPDMDGLELLAHIRSTPALERLPVLIFTVRSDQEIRERAATFEVAGYLLKPADITKLRETVAEILDDQLQPLADLHGTLQRLDVTPEMYFEMLDQLAGTISSSEVEVRKALAEKDRRALTAWVSSQWGAAKNLGAERLASVLGRQTQASERSEFETARSLISEVQRENLALQLETRYLQQEHEQAKLRRKAGTTYFSTRRRSLATRAEGALEAEPPHEAPAPDPGTPPR